MYFQELFNFHYPGLYLPFSKDFSAIIKISTISGICSDMEIKTISVTMLPRKQLPQGL